MNTNLLRGFKHAARRALPAALIDRLVGLKRLARKRRFYQQQTTTLVIDGIPLTVPVSHPLASIRAWQPLRDKYVTVLARHVCEKYRGCEALDIGANVGDTAVLLLSAAQMTITLVEGSDYFFDLLQRNAGRLPGKVRLVKAFVGDGAPLRCDLIHWGGTARLANRGGSAAQISTVKLEQIATKVTKLIKIDTDGSDYTILQSSAAFLRESLPIVLYENEVRDAESLRDSLETLSVLESVGYQYFVLWDDAGHLLGLYQDKPTVADLVRFLYANDKLDRGRTIPGLDIAAFAAQDQAVAEAVVVEYRGLMLGIFRTEAEEMGAAAVRKTTVERG